MKILFVIDKMKNYAGIERILTCKMNYIVSHTSYEIYLTTYEQQSQPLPFPLDANIIYKPLNIMMPQRSKMTLFRWVKAYHGTRKCFKSQFKSLIKDIQPDLVVSTVYSYQVLDIIIETCHHKGIKTVM